MFSVRRPCIASRSRVMVVCATMCRYSVCKYGSIWGGIEAFEFSKSNAAFSERSNMRLLCNGLHKVFVSVRSNLLCSLFQVHCVQNVCERLNVFTGNTAKQTTDCRQWKTILSQLLADSAYLCESNNWMWSKMLMSHQLPWNIQQWHACRAVFLIQASDWMMSQISSMHELFLGILVVWHVWLSDTPQTWLKSQQFVVNNRIHHPRVCFRRLASSYRGIWSL